METKITVQKSGKYYQINYVTGIRIPTNYNKYIWETNKKYSLLFINALRGIESELIKLNETNETPYKVELIVSIHLDAISSIASGFDIRSGMSHEEIADRFYYGYDKRFKDRFKECLDIKEYFDNIGINEGYSKNWSKYDRYNDLVKEFQFDLKLIGYDDFRVDEMKNMDEALDALNKMIDEARKIEDETNKSS